MQSKNKKRTKVFRNPAFVKLFYETGNL